MKKTHTRVIGPRKSTTYTERGKTIYTDSITGHRVKVVKYTTRNSCFGSDRFRRIEISYDSTGKRTGRENVLRQERKERRERDKACDSCGKRRPIRAKF